LGVAILVGDQNRVYERQRQRQRGELWRGFGVEDRERVMGREVWMLLGGDLGVETVEIG
jgi:hypothetical protein